MVHPLLVPQTAELTDWTKNSVCLTACQARRFPLLLTGDAAEEIGAEDLHLARLGRHTHVRAGLAGRIRTFGAVVILRAAEHLNNCFVVGVDKDSG